MGVRDRLVARIRSVVGGTTKGSGPPAGHAATVAGVFDRVSDAEIALNNLDEAEYPPDSISVLTDDPRRTHLLTDVRGPLSGVALDQLPTRLRALGASPAEAEGYRAAIAAGAVFVAVAAPAGSEDSAAEILTDQQAARVRVLRSSREGA